ncbi:Uncharacterised protein [Mycobacteroides abscessus subsp. massiliense]|nr:Uncharacterised protein [Mycobacteroides abscessus subsp. massiliense]
MHRTDRRTISVNILVVGRRECPDVQLAIDRHGQHGQTHYRGGHHIARKPFGQRCPCADRIRSAGDVTDQTFIARTILTRYHGCVLDTVQRGQRRLDFTELDPIAADLDLLIGTAQIVQLSVGAPPHQITGAIHPGAGPTERTGHEPRRGQTRSAPIADTYPRTAQVQLTNHTGGHRTQPFIQYEERGPGRWRADRRRAQTGRQRGAGAQPHRGLGGAVDIDHSSSRRPPVDQFR